MPSLTLRLVIGLPSSYYFPIINKQTGNKKGLAQLRASPRYNRYFMLKTKRLALSLSHLLPLRFRLAIPRLAIPRHAFHSSPSLPLVRHDMQSSV